MATTDRFDKLTKLVAAIFLITIVVWQIFLLGIFLRELFPDVIDWGTTWDNAEKLTGAIEHAATVAALVLGAFWTYYKFIKGRVLISRLELGVSGEFVKLHMKNYLRASVQLENVGSSKVARETVSLKVFAEKPRSDVQAEDAQKYKVRNVSWEELLPFNILESHGWIEPGETIHDQKLIEILTTEDIAYKIDFEIFAGGTTWTATSIVVPEQKDEKRVIGVKLFREEEGHGG